MTSSTEKLCEKHKVLVKKQSMCLKNYGEFGIREVGTGKS